MVEDVIADGPLLQHQGLADDVVVVSLGDQPQPLHLAAGAGEGGGTHQLDPQPGELRRHSLGRGWP